MKIEEVDKVLAELHEYRNGMKDLFNVFQSIYKNALDHYDQKIKGFEDFKVTLLNKEIK